MKFHVNPLLADDFYEMSYFLGNILQNFTILECRLLLIDLLNNADHLVNK